MLLVAARLVESPSGARPALWSRPELLLVGTLTLLALSVRMIGLADVPANFSGDEGEMGEMARAVLAGRLEDPFTTGWLGHATLWFYAQALSLTVVGDDVTGLRALSAVLGAATIPALYWFARLLHGPLVAILAAFLLAGYHFHVHFSRIGLNNVADPLLVVLAFAALVSGYRARSPFRLALAGVALGLAQHSYYGARLALFAVGAMLVHQLVFDRRRLAGAAPGLALGVIGFVVAFGPLVRVPLFHWADFQSGLTRQGLFQTGAFADRVAAGASPLRILFGQTRDALGGLATAPVRGPFYEPWVPLLDPVSAVLAAIGLVLVLRRWRRPESAVLLAWLLGAVLFGNVLLVDPPQAHHYVSIAPLLCLLAASGLDAAARFAGALAPRAAPVIPVLTLVVVAALATWSLRFYFEEYSPRRSYGGERTQAATEIAERLASGPRDTFIYFHGAPYTYLGNGTIRFIAQPQGVDVLEPLAADEPLSLLPERTRPVFVFHPARAAEIEVVRRRYRGGVIRTFRVPEGAPAFLMYEAKPG